MRTSWASSTSWSRSPPAARTAIPTPRRRSCATPSAGTCANCGRWAPTRSSRIAIASSASSAPSPSRRLRRSGSASARFGRARSLPLLQVSRDHRDELVGLEESPVPVSVGGEQLLLLHLLDGLAALEAPRDQRDDLVQPVAELLHVRDGRDRAVAGNDLRVRWDLRKYLVDRRDHSAH